MSREPVLHITNGGSAVHSMEKAGLSGVFLSWDDPLHDGPVPAGLSLARLSARRAEFLTEGGLAEPTEAKRRFEARDATLADFARFDEVVLWFEHDLYDQLQLIQILDWFGDQNWRGTRLSLVQSGEHLGEIPPQRYPELLKRRQPATAEQLRQARTAWRAFTSPDPTEVDQARKSSGSALPYLAAALRRHLEEFPSIEEGLGRTERQILRAVAGGHQDPASAFQANQRLEEAKFLGDWSFWIRVENLLAGDHPLLRATTGSFRRPPRDPDETGDFRRQRLQVTSEGVAVLEGRADRVQLNGYHQWFGGALLDDTRLWRWDRRRQFLIPS